MISTILGTQICFGVCSEISIKSNINVEGLFCFPNIVNIMDTATPKYSTGVTCLSRSSMIVENKMMTITQNFTIIVITSTSSTSAGFGSSKSIVSSITLTGKITPADMSVSSSDCRSIYVHRRSHSFLSFALIIILSIFITQIHVLSIVKM
jgi:hypothetical protein